MGAWGTGNFENDAGLDFVANTVASPLKAQLSRAVDNPSLADPRGWESNKILAAVETLAIVCEAIRIDPPQTSLVERCRDVCLREWDVHIDACDPDTAYKEGRRAVIAATFERLLTVCHGRDQSMRQTARDSAASQPRTIRQEGRTKFPSYWELVPDDEVSYLSMAETLERLAAAFPAHEFDAEAGRAFAAQRFAELSASGDAPNLLQRYGGEPPVLVRLADDKDASAVLEFYLWPNRGILISFDSATQEERCFPLLERLAAALGYLLVDDT